MPHISFVKLYDWAKVLLISPRGLNALFDGRCSVLFRNLFAHTRLFLSLLSLIGLLNHAELRLLVHRGQRLVVVVRIGGARAVVEVCSTRARSLNHNYVTTSRAFN